MSTGLRTQAVIIIAITILSTGCLGRHKQKQQKQETKQQQQKIEKQNIEEQQQTYNTREEENKKQPDLTKTTNPKNETNNTFDPKPVQDNNYTIKRSIDSDGLRYVIRGKDLDKYKYDWKITNANNEPVKFYGQNSQAVIITDIPKTDSNTYQINITCTFNSSRSVTTKTFLIDNPFDIELLEIRKGANEARALWSTNNILGKLPSKVTEDQLAEMKLSKKLAQVVLGRVYKPANTSLFLGNALILGTIEDEQFGREYPYYESGPGHTTLYSLEALLCAESKRFQKQIKDLLVLHKSFCSGGGPDLMYALMSSIDIGTLNNANVLKQFLIELKQCVSSDACNELDTSSFLSRVSEWRNEVNRYGLPPSDRYYSRLTMQVWWYFGVDS